MKSHSNKSGFALVMVLSLMAFVLLLLLSITTLTQLETRSVETAQSQLQAQMNALLGLQQALGELQATAGHDQRVTATGSLWKDPEVGTEHYVGVWSSEDKDRDGEPDGTFQRWLVSNGDIAARENVNYVATAAPISLDGADGYVATDSDYVLLVGGGSATQKAGNVGGMQGLVAKKVAVNPDRASGSFAWWVGDNGVKAIVTEVDPYQTRLRTGTDWPVNANTLSMQGTNIGVLADFSQLDYRDAGAVEKLLRSSELADLQLVESSVSSQAVKEHFHDLTTRSMGLQTNTRHGGLKRDLSLLFEMSDADFNDPNGDFISEMAAVTKEESGGAGVGGLGLVYDNMTEAPWYEKAQQVLLYKYPISGDASGDGVIYGPSFGMLRDYYRLYKGITNKETQPTLEEGWVHTYQPSKARVIQNGNGNNSGSKARALARKYTLGMQGWRKYLSNGSPETTQSSVSVGTQWGVLTGDAIHSIRSTQGSYTPYLSRVTNVFALTSYSTGSVNLEGHDEYEFDIIWQPHITLHNPYNVRIQSQEMRYTAELRHLKLKSVYCSYNDENGKRQEYTNNYLSSGGEVKLRDIFPKSTRDMSWEGSEVILKIPRTPFEPGEVKVFSVRSELTPAHGSALTVDLEAVAASATGGIRLNAASIVDDYRGFVASNGAFRNFIGSDEVEIKFKLEKAGAQFVDIWNPELNDWDAMFSVKHGETAQLFGNVTWDQGAVQLYRDRVDSYEASAIASLVFDDYVKPLSFSEDLGGGGSLVGISDSRKVYPNFMLTNPMAASFHEWGAGLIDEFTWSGVFHSYAESFVSAYQHPRSQVRDGSSRGSWGNDHGSNGPSRAVLFELPTAPMQTIGQFQHAVLHPMPYFSVNAVGNSFPSPFVPYLNGSKQIPATFRPDRSGSGGWSTAKFSGDGVFYAFEVNWPLSGVDKRNEYCFYDFSYMLNDVIWDGYFFSSIAPTQSLMGQSYRLPSDVAKGEVAIANDIERLVVGFVDGLEELRNSRMKLLPSELAASQVVHELQDFRKSAKHLGVSGAFNVNSTSVDAWKALLSGYREAAVAHSENVSVQVQQLGEGISAFPGMSLAGGGAAGAFTNLANGSAWAGFMKLTDDMIEKLAKKIVAQIIERSEYRGGERGRNGSPVPALSLGQFINRINANPNSSKRDLTQGGTIQQAIVAAGINDNLSGLPVAEFKAENFNQTHNPTPVAWVRNYREYYPDPNYTFDVRNVSPLALTQADILQAIGPLISARSDTFTIRAYGDVEDPLSGEIQSQVWCEATVQRTMREENSTNKPNHRLFEIVGFRWLSPEEI